MLDCAQTFGKHFHYSFAITVPLWSQFLGGPVVLNLNYLPVTVSFCSLWNCQRMHKNYPNMDTLHTISNLWMAVATKYVNPAAAPKASSYNLHSMHLSLKFTNYVELLKLKRWGWGQLQPSAKHLGRVGHLGRELHGVSIN